MSLQNTVETVRRPTSAWRRRVQGEWERRKEQPMLLLMDTVHLLLAATLAPTHVLFGAYPLGIALVAALSGRLWILLPGVVLGSLSLGTRGVVYALTATITVLLRAAISGVGRREGGEGGGLFRERAALRASAAVLGGCICAVYELLFSGFSLTAVLYGASMIALSGGLALVLSGVEQIGMSARDMLLGQARLPAADGGHGTLGAVWVRLSLLTLCLFVPLSLGEVSLFGVSAGYVLAALLTLFSARRFGLLSAVAVGFVGVLGLSTSYAVAYALGGLAAALLLPLGLGVSLLGAAVCVGGWCALTGGLVGFVSVFPEFALASALFAPLAKRMPPPLTERATHARTHRATDMVGTMAMSLRAKAASAPARLEQAMASLTPLLRRLHTDPQPPDALTVRRLLEEAATVTAGSDAPWARVLDGPREDTLMALAARLSSGEALTEELLLPYSEDRTVRTALVREYAVRLSAYEAERRRPSDGSEGAVLCEVFARMLAEVREREEREHAPNVALTRTAEEVFVRHGFADGVIRVFGERHAYVLAAAEDPTGERISDPRLLTALSEALGLTLGQPTFFRKESMVLMECHATARFRLEVGVASAPRHPSEISGDTAHSFEGADGTVYLALSDGMGTGEGAARASAFAVEYLSRLMGTGCDESTALFLLNHLLRTGDEECSTTVDLFSFDPVRGDGRFCKSGACASYLKRAGSLYRVRSQTAPLGLLGTLDAERIRVDVQAEDVIVMLSDGISPSVEDDPWLVELLSHPAREDLHAYAARILREAQKHAREEDDRTVLVARVVAV